MEVGYTDGKKGRSFPKEQNSTRDLLKVARPLADDLAGTPQSSEVLEDRVPRHPSLFHAAVPFGSLDRGVVNSPSIQSKSS